MNEQVTLTGELYRPSNGSSGESFMANFCNGCLFDNNRGCHIGHATMGYMEDDELYPKQWQYVKDSDGKEFPICLGFLDKNKKTVEFNFDD